MIQSLWISEHEKINIVAIPDNAEYLVYITTSNKKKNDYTCGQHYYADTQQAALMKCLRGQPKPTSEASGNPDE